MTLPERVRTFSLGGTDQEAVSTVISAFLDDPETTRTEKVADTQRLLDAFAGDVGPTRTVPSITAAEIWAWVICTADGQQARLNAARALFRWCYIWSRVKDNPTLNLHLSHEQLPSGRIVNLGSARHGRRLKLPARGSASYQFVRAFEQDQRRRCLSPKTIYTRRRVLAAFSEFVGETPMTKVGRREIEGFLDSLGSVKPATLAAYLKTFRAFFEWMAAQELRPDNPTAGIKSARVPRALPRPISEANLARALEMADGRMLAWLCLGAYQGFRCIEMSRLRVEHIRSDDDPPMIVADGKGSKERAVPLHPRTLAALRAYGLPASGFVFTRLDGLPLKAGTVTVRISTFLHGAGIGASAHPLRHRFGTRLYAETKDIRLVQEMMGHASPATTAIYTAHNPLEAVAGVSRL